MSRRSLDIDAAAVGVFLDRVDAIADLPAREVLPLVGWSERRLAASTALGLYHEHLFRAGVGDVARHARLALAFDEIGLMSVAFLDASLARFENLMGRPAAMARRAMARTRQLQAVLRAMDRASAQLVAWPGPGKAVARAMRVGVN